MPDFVESVMFHPALAFSQRMPPVQYMTIFLSYVPASSRLLLAAAHGRYLPEFERVFKVPHFILIVVTHVDNSASGSSSMAFTSAACRYSPNCWHQSEDRQYRRQRYDRGPHAQYPEGFPVIIQRDIQA